MTGRIHVLNCGTLGLREQLHAIHTAASDAAERGGSSAEGQCAAAAAAAARASHDRPPFERTT
eukprot:4542770-Prymnesium_polylepis.1